MQSNLIDLIKIGEYAASLILQSALCPTDKVKCTSRAHSKSMHHTSSDLDNPYPRRSTYRHVTDRFVNHVDKALRSWGILGTSNACLSTTFCAEYSLLKKISRRDPTFLNHPKHLKSRQLVYYPYHERCFLFPFLIRMDKCRQRGTEYRYGSPRNGRCTRWNENISTHVHVGHLAGVDFSGFSRELVRTALGPVSGVGFGRRCSSAGVASPPKSISVTPLDRCHRVPAVISPFA